MPLTREVNQTEVMARLVEVGQKYSVIQELHHLVISEVSANMKLMFQYSMKLFKAKVKISGLQDLDW